MFLDVNKSTFTSSSLGVEKIYAATALIKINSFKSGSS